MVTLESACNTTPNYILLRNKIGHLSYILSKHRRTEPLITYLRCTSINTANQISLEKLLHWSISKRIVTLCLNFYRAQSLVKIWGILCLCFLALQSNYFNISLFHPRKGVSNYLSNNKEKRKLDRQDILD